MNRSKHPFMWLSSLISCSSVYTIPLLLVSLLAIPACKWLTISLKTATGIYWSNSVLGWKQPSYQGRTLVSPFVGMARKQDGGSNGCISNYTTITRIGASVTHFEALFYPFRVLSLLTRPPKSPVSNAKITKWQPAKMQFCSSFFLQPG